MKTKWNFSKLKKEFDRLRWTKVLGNSGKLFCVAHLSPETTLELFPELPGHKRNEYNAQLRLFERAASHALNCNVYVTDIDGWNFLTITSYASERIKATKTKEEQERQIASLTEFSSEGEAPYIDLRPRPHWLWVARLWLHWWDNQKPLKGETFREFRARVELGFKLYL